MISIGAGYGRIALEKESGDCHEKFPPEKTLTG
jgi:hypothetical protein